MATQSATRLSRLTCEVHPPVARISLHNPPLNVIDIPMMQELAQALAEIESRPHVPLLILGGLGKAFSVGVDVVDLPPGKVYTILWKFHSVIRGLFSTKMV